MNNVAALVLAAGASRRLGQPKQLLTIGSETLVGRAVRAAREGSCAPVAVVVGAERDAVAAALPEAAAEIVLNPDWERGLGSSIHAGLQHILQAGATPDALVLLACDQPYVDGTLVAALISAWQTSGQLIAAACYAETLGIPALFERSCFDALWHLPQDSGAKSLLRAAPERVAAVPFPRGAIDIDTPEDLGQLPER